MLRQQSECLAELVSSYEALSDNLPCKNHIISNLLLTNKEVSVEIINRLIQSKSSNNQLIAITSNAFSILSNSEEIDQFCFESFGNGNFPSSNDANKENDNINSYIKLSNDNIISKIKSKLNSSTQISNPTSRQTGLKISDSPINKSLNEISFDMEHSMIKNNSVNFLLDLKQGKESPPKKDLSQFVNRNNRSKVPKKASTSCEFPKNKAHLSDSSIASEMTSLSSKRNYRQSSNGNIYHSQIMIGQGNNEAKKRTKMFYKNIKNVKSKYGGLVKNSNFTSKGASFKGIKLDQYINTKMMK